MNSLLHFSTANRDARFPFWTGVEGTFGVIVYNALVSEGFQPESVGLDFGRDVRVVRYRGRKKTFRGGINANKIVHFVKSVESKLA